MYARHQGLTIIQGASLWPSHNSNTFYHDESSTSPPNSNNANAGRRPTSHHGTNHNHNNARSSTSALLASLNHDENTIEQRKLNVRRFGAGWIRPPGVAKTLQALKDEELEKEEQELMQRREQVMMDLAAAQQEAANAEQREQAEVEEEGQEEHDLDDEVPEAEASASEITDSDSSDEEGSVSADETAQEDLTVPFNEDSFIEGSMLEAEVSHMLEMEEAEMAGVLQDERDLDDDIPEAGSYEHTDSELEDSSDDDNASRPPGLNSVRSRRSRRSSGRRTSGRRSSGLPSGVTAHGGLVAGGMAGFRTSSRGGLDLGADLGHGRSSFGIDGSSSILEGSSFLRSSPAATASRGTLRDRFLGAVRGGRRG